MTTGGRSAAMISCPPFSGRRPQLHPLASPCRPHHGRPKWYRPRIEPWGVAMNRTNWRDCPRRSRERAFHFPTIPRRPARGVLQGRTSVGSGEGGYVRVDIGGVLSNVTKKKTLST